MHYEVSKIRNERDDYNTTKLTLNKRAKNLRVLKNEPSQPQHNKMNNQVLSSIAFNFLIIVINAFVLKWNSNVITDSGKHNHSEILQCLSEMRSSCPHQARCVAIFDLLILCSRLCGRKDVEQRGPFPRFFLLLWCVLCIISVMITLNAILDRLEFRQDLRAACK